MRVAINRVVFVLLLGLALPALAQRAEGSRAAASGVYEAEVPVRSQGDAERNAAYGRALSQVLGKLSGERNPGARPGLGEELRQARDYVQSFDYRQDAGRSANGTASFGTTLVVRFRPDMVNELAARTGVPVWPEPRPRPVLWLAIDDGSGPRLVGLQQNNAARSILDRARERGYRLGLPQGTAAEQAMAGAIWRGDTAAIARISRAYTPPMQLVGKLYRAGNGWRADWIFVDNGRVLARNSSSDADARRTMAAGADMAANALIRRYARATRPASPPGDVRITVEGVQSAADYLRLLAWLERHEQVGAVIPATAEGTTWVGTVHLKAGLASFRRVLERDGFLATTEDDTRFRLN